MPAPLRRLPEPAQRIARRPAPATAAACAAPPLLPRRAAPPPASAPAASAPPPPASRRAGSWPARPVLHVGRRRGGEGQPAARVYLPFDLSLAQKGLRSSPSSSSCAPPRYSHLKSDGVRRSVGGRGARDEGCGQRVRPHDCQRAQRQQACAVQEAQAAAQGLAPHQLQRAAPVQQHQQASAGDGLQGR